MLVALCALVAVPPAALAGSGGSGLSPGGSPIGPAGTTGTSGTSGSGSTPLPTPENGDGTVSTSASGLTLQTVMSAMLRRGLSFSGTAAPSTAGQTIEIERSGHETNWTWQPTVAATVAADGTFSAVWRTDHIGRFAIRAVVAPSASSAAIAQSATVTPALTVTVYRPSRATQYGPGFYGRRTACGQQLTTGMIGLANRTLRCGTKVAVYWQGRTLIVPVIDRGPYANGADWDLTEATAQALGISGTAEIGAVSLSQR